jgi:Domain of unknown function (DUF1963)
MILKNSIFENFINSLNWDANELPSVRKWLSLYETTGRKYFTPKYKKQDIRIPKQRLGNILGGAPYVSKNYPWPTSEESNLPMQPIVQICLRDAGIALHEDLGDGLLQLWARVDENRAASLSRGSNNLLKIVIIPKNDVLIDEIEGEVDIQPWREIECNKSNDDYQVAYPDGSLKLKNGSIISWEDKGDMFAHSAALDLSIENEEYRLYEDTFDWINDHITTPKNAPDIYLGGHGGQAGGFEDPTINTSLLFRMHDNNSLYIGINYHKNKHDELIFSPSLHYH